MNEGLDEGVRTNNNGDGKILAGNNEDGKILAYIQEPKDLNNNVNHVSKQVKSKRSLSKASG